MELHNLIVSHIQSLLPGLWDYSRPINWITVLTVVVIGIVVLRALAKLLPALLILALFILVFHGHLHASPLAPSDPSGAPYDPPITIQNILQAEGWYGPVTINTAVDEVCYGDLCAPLAGPWNEESMTFCPSNDCGVPSDLYPSTPVVAPPPPAPVVTPEPRYIELMMCGAVFCFVISRFSRRSESRDLKSVRVNEAGQARNARSSG
jgi:hypothetical protein